MKTKFSFIIMAVALMFTATSCNDWLDLKPADQISEDVNFSSLSGFKQATNGIYIELNSSSLYGRTLTCDFIEVIAQRYAVNENENTINGLLMKQEWGSLMAESIIEGIWQKGYNLIANTNMLIKNCETHRDVLPDEYYHLIKGEAYALRAYLHFDMFRLFGPIYDPDADALALPYYSEFALDINPRSTAHDFMENVLADLAVAQEELKDDPIIRFGKGGDPADLFLQQRNLRLNVYAVDMLLARVYYYMHNDEKAAEYARKVVGYQEEKFPWVSELRLTGASPDAVFSSEVMFALHNINRKNLYTNLFDANNLKESTLLAPLDGVMNNVFDNNLMTDFRGKAYLRTTAEVNGNTYRIFSKYNGTDSLYNQMIPMLRSSEAYLILAQTTTDKNERNTVFTTFRNHRGLSGVTRDYEFELSDYHYNAIEKEWIKEFFGEGQLFYYYKRNKYGTMRSATDQYGYAPVDFPLDKYVIPMPDGEMKYN